MQPGSSQPARPVYLDVGHGHAATLERSPTGGRVVIRGPRGVPPVVLDFRVTEAGVTVRLRDDVLFSPPAPSSPAPRSAFDATAPSAIPTPTPTPIPGFAIPAPPPTPVPAPSSRLSLLQYASLRAACVDASPGQLADLRARYLLDEGTDALEAQAWAHKFAQDPAVFASYKHYFQLFRSRASASPRGEVARP